jgi:hypothetical protein
MNIVSGSIMTRYCFRSMLLFSTLYFFPSALSLAAEPTDTALEATTSSCAKVRMAGRARPCEITVSEKGINFVLLPDRYGNIKTPDIKIAWHSIERWWCSDVNSWRGLYTHIFYTKDAELSHTFRYSSSRDRYLAVKFFRKHIPSAEDLDPIGSSGSTCEM